MEWKEVIEVGAAVMAALGGAGVILFGLSNWFGKIWAARILESDRNKYQERIEAISHQLSIRKTAYERYLDLIVEYHDLVYRHYRLCQQTERTDVVTHPDKSDIKTKSNYMDKIDDFKDHLSKIEGKLRIILPQETLNIHNELIGAFNGFSRIVKEFDNDAQSTDRHKLNEAMKKIVELQKQLEESLRSILRTENVLP